VRTRAAAGIEYLRHARVGGLTIALVLALAAGACDGSSQVGPANGSGSFIAPAVDGVFFVRWDREKSNLTGSLVETIISGPPGSLAVTHRIPLTGTISANRLSLQLHPNGGNHSTLTGRVYRTGFSLSYPAESGGQPIILDFSRADTPAYKAAVTLLQLSQYISPCKLYAQHHDAQLTLSGPDAAADCARFVENAPTDATWTTTPQSTPDDLTNVCRLSEGNNSVTVKDRRGKHYGSEACNTLTGEGWTSAQSG
jgi:hypothetical protein